MSGQQGKTKSSEKALMLDLVAQAYEQPPSLVTLSIVLKKGDFQDTPLICSTHFPLHNITDLIEMQILGFNCVNINRTI